jgi:hypothetical protein
VLKRAFVRVPPDLPDGAAMYRDKGKWYLITEMPAYQAEMWAIHALQAIASGGTDLPQNIIEYGMAGLVVVGLNSLLKAPRALADPLLEEMMRCVQFVMDRPKELARALDEASGADIEEVATRMWLRNEVFKLHTGFSFADAIREMLASAGKHLIFEDTPTSEQTSAPS